ncbi:MAG: phospholipid carrier-dependent glycosyltransferase, partial [Planctomycetota bacterium]
MQRNGQTIFWIVFGLVLAWAGFVRAWGVWGRSFWMDEAAVASAVTDHSWRELLGQTDLPIAPMFAISTKLVGSLIVPPEVGLRLLPILFGIGCVPLTYLVMRTLRVPRVTALVGTALCASSPSLVIWSREVKQYQIEAFFSVLLALLVFKLRRCSVAKRQRILAGGIIVICMFGPWFGYGLIFSAVVLLALLVLLRPVFGSRRFAVAVATAGLCAMVVS